MKNRVWMSWVALLLAGCGDGTLLTTGTAPAGEAGSALFVQSSVVWPAGKIPVCWLSPPSQYATEKANIRAAIRNTWEAVSGVEFTGWSTCTAERTGVRIAIRDERAWSMVGTTAIGYEETMLLNFEQQQVNKNCRQRYGIRCIDIQAIHEFGHAMGFRHEHARSDTPDTCNEDGARMGGGDWTIGPWDLDSVMNYCNPTYDGMGQLSPVDVEGAQAVYGMPKVTSGIASTSDGRAWVVTARGDGRFHAAVFHQGRWTAGEDLGGCFSSEPTLVTNGTKVEVFARGCEKGLWHRTLDPSGLHGQWEALGGVLTSAPAAVAWPDGRLDVFVRGVERDLWTRKFYPGSGWVDWTPLGGVIQWAPSAIRRGDTLDVVVVGLERKVWRRSLSRGHGWRDWEMLDLDAYGPVSVGSLDPSRLDVFAVGPNDDLTCAALTSAGWTAKQSVLAPLLDAQGAFVRNEYVLGGGSQAVVSRPGAYDIVYRDRSGRLTRLEFKPRTSMYGTGFEFRSSPPGAADFSGPPRLSGDSANGLDLLLNESGTGFSHYRLDKGSSVWGSKQSL